MKTQTPTAQETFAQPGASPCCALADGSAVRITQDGENELQRVADELEQLAEEIRNRGMRGHKWGEILPQWNRLRSMERSLRWMIEG